MTKLTAEQKKQIACALAKFSEATQELASILEETGYELESAPFEDAEDFSYDVLSMVEEEMETLDIKDSAAKAPHLRIVSA